MQEEKLKEKTISSLIWKYFERMGAQIIQFVVSIILARILMPEDYGAIALITVFIAIAQVFVQSGLPTALIRKNNADDLDYSSVFYFSLAIAFALYAVIFFTAPIIANFYELPILSSVLRVLGLVVIVGAYNSIQNTILAKQLLFKRLFISTFGAIIVSGILGIISALLGFGVWALVIQQLSSVIITSIIMTFTVKWRPKLMFSIKRVGVLMKFGWKLLISALLNVGYDNLYSLIIGKKYSKADLGYWNKSKQFPSLLVDNINGTIGSVMFPVYSKIADDKIKLKSAVRRSIRMSSYLIIPMMMGLALCAEPIVRLLLGEKWLMCVPFLQGWCFCYALMPIHTTNLQVYNALGRSDVFLYLEIAKKVLGIAVLIIALPFGLLWMMFGMMCTSVIGGIINAFPNIFILKYSVWAQIRDIMPPILLSVVMGIAIYLCSFLQLHYVIVMLIQILVGLSVYILLSYIFKFEMFNYIIESVKKGVKKIKDKKKAKLN